MNTSRQTLPIWIYINIYGSYLSRLIKLPLAQGEKFPLHLWVQRLPNHLEPPCPEKKNVAVSYVLTIILEA